VLPLRDGDEGEYSKWPLDSWRDKVA
jgi:hypothetical protein